MSKNYEDLVRSGQLKRVSGRGLDQAARLLKRATRDMLTAELLISLDEAAAMDLIYKGIFHAANALLRLQGYRPGGRRQHVGVAKAVARTLGKKSDPLLFFYDRLRRKRNKFEYQAVFTMSSYELENALKQARGLISEIRSNIQKYYPDFISDL
jgi:uncharacterized protein (UPF0332 family)